MASGRPTDWELSSLDEYVCKLLIKRFLTRRELKQFYPTNAILDVALTRIGNHYPLMEEDKIKGKTKKRYKILTFQDIDNYLESRKSFVY